jgi:Rrf2 family protein
MVAAAAGVSNPDSLTERDPMKPSAATHYAVRALAHLAAHEGVALVASHDLARVTGAPEKYLLKALNLLVRARLLHSLKGPHGGYRLARPAKAITLLEIVEAADGPLRGQVSEAEGAASAPLNRRLTAISDAAADLTRKELARVRLADLARG